MTDYDSNNNDDFRTRQQPPKSGGLSRGRVVLLLQIVAFSIVGLLLVAIIPKGAKQKSETAEKITPTKRNLSELDEVWEKQRKEPPKKIKIRGPVSDQEDKDEEKARQSKLEYSISRKPVGRKRRDAGSQNFGYRLGALSSKLNSVSPPIYKNGRVYKDGIAQDPELDHGRHFRKEAFLDKKPARGVTNPYGLQRSLSPYTVSGGTVIHAALISGISSDLPGQIMAQVTQNVYDSKTGRNLLIPQGSKLLGKYDSVVAFDQDRVLLAWYRIVLPNGNSVVLENLPASDQSGYSGLKDEVDNHTWEKIKGVALATLLSIGAQLSFGSDDDELLTALRDSIQETTEKATDKMIDKYLNRQPTLKIRPGWPMVVIVNKDLILTSYR